MKGWLLSLLLIAGVLLIADDCFGLAPYWRGVFGGAALICYSWGVVK